MRKKIAVIAVIILLAIGGFIYEQTAGSKPHATSITSQPKSVSKTVTPIDTFNKKQFSTTDPSSPWVVVNKQHPLNPITYAPSDLISVGNGQYMRAEAGTALIGMIAGAKAAGYTITADSGYRSYSYQITVYGNEVKNYGQAQADSESARPGFSEHQTGWAVDIGGGGCNIDDCFANTAEGKWTAANAYKYGFILRYTAADTGITGYRSEAWHFRYVGVALATEMRKENIPTLEQFFGISGGATYKS